MRNIFFGNPYCHQGVVMRTQLVRDCGGFDERRRIFADYALLVESHRRGSRIVFEDRPYAVYYLGGISAQGHGVFPEETMSVSRKLLGVTDEEVAVFRKRVYFPLRRVIPFLTHKDKTFRRAAQYMIARNLLWHLGLKRPDTDAWYK